MSFAVHEERGCEEKLELLTASMLRRALIVLKDQISTTKGLIEPVYHPANRFELSFYRNQVRAVGVVGLKRHQRLLLPSAGHTSLCFGEHVVCRSL